MQAVQSDVYLLIDKSFNCIGKKRVVMKEKDWSESVCSESRGRNGGGGFSTPSSTRKGSSK